MKVTLVAKTVGEGDISPEYVCASAARGCYSIKPSATLMGEMNDAKMVKTLSHAIEGGHTSVLEHMQFTFSIEEVSRALTHQLVRHRIGTAFSQQSQRYVGFYDDRFRYYIPQSIQNNPEVLDKYMALMRQIGQFYSEAVADEGIPEEDARYALPNATLTNITMTINGREALHLIGLRACTRAQKEIRELADAIVPILKKECPYVFQKLGANCEQLGYCPEKESCGRKPSLNVLLDCYEQNKNRL